MLSMHVREAEKKRQQLQAAFSELTQMAPFEMPFDVCRIMVCR